MPVALDTVFDLSLARTKLARDVDHPLSAHGISLADLAILRELRREADGKLRRSELAQRLGITPSGVARQVAPLERMGLVDRESHDPAAPPAPLLRPGTRKRTAHEPRPTAEAAPERAFATPCE